MEVLDSAPAKGNVQARAPRIAQGDEKAGRITYLLTASAYNKSYSPVREYWLNARENDQRVLNTTGALPANPIEVHLPGSADQSGYYRGGRNIAIGHAGSVVQNAASSNDSVTTWHRRGNQGFFFRENNKRSVIVRNYGDVLSVDQLVDLLTNPLETTKDGDNDYGGGLGIGSLSGLFISDRILFEVFHNGVVKFIEVSTSGESVNVVDSLPSAATDEANGVRVTMTLRPDVDANELSREFVTTLVRYDESERVNVYLNPEVLVNYQTPSGAAFIKNHEYHYENGKLEYGWNIYHSNEPSYGKVLIDGTHYDASGSLVNDEVEYVNGVEGRFGVVYNAKVGELRITTSRESAAGSADEVSLADLMKEKGLKEFDLDLTKELSPKSPKTADHRKLLTRVVKEAVAARKKVAKRVETVREQFSLPNATTTGEVSFDLVLTDESEKNNDGDGGDKYKARQERNNRFVASIGSGTNTFRHDGFVYRIRYTSNSAGAVSKIAARVTADDGLLLGEDSVESMIRRRLSSLIYRDEALEELRENPGEWDLSEADALLVRRFEAAADGGANQVRNTAVRCSAPTLTADIKIGKNEVEWPVVATAEDVNRIMPLALAFDKALREERGYVKPVVQRQKSDVHYLIYHVGRDYERTAPLSSIEGEPEDLAILALTEREWSVLRNRKSVVGELGGFTHVITTPVASMNFDLMVNRASEVADTVWYWDAAEAVKVARTMVETARDKWENAPHWEGIHNTLLATQSSEATARYETEWSVAARLVGLFAENDSLSEEDREFVKSLAERDTPEGVDELQEALQTARDVQRTVKTAAWLTEKPNFTAALKASPELLEAVLDLVESLDESIATVAGEDADEDEDSGVVLSLVEAEAV